MMTYKKFKILLLFLITSFLLTRCTKTVEITYDVYFWSASIDVTQGLNTLFINGVENGELQSPSVEVDCSVVETILNQLLVVQLSNGIHEIEVRGDNGEVKSAGSLEIKYNGSAKKIGLSSGGTISGMESTGIDDCLTVKISY